MVRRLSPSPSASQGLKRKWARFRTMWKCVSFVADAYRSTEVTVPLIRVQTLMMMMAVVQFTERTIIMLHGLIRCSTEGCIPYIRLLCIEHKMSTSLPKRSEPCMQCSSIYQRFTHASSESRVMELCRAKGVTLHVVWHDFLSRNYISICRCAQLKQERVCTSPV